MMYLSSSRSGMAAEVAIASIEEEGKSRRAARRQLFAINAAALPEKYGRTWFMALEVFIQALVDKHKLLRRQGESMEASPSADQSVSALADGAQNRFHLVAKIILALKSRALPEVPEARLENS